jgi:hypothetical protein
MSRGHAHRRAAMGNLRRWATLGCPKGFVGGCALEGPALQCLVVLSVRMADERERLIFLHSDYVIERYDPVVHRSAQSNLNPYDERWITCAQ